MAETKMIVGQRWLSESEPELGLGQIKEVTGRQVVLWFSGGEIERRYVRGNAPLRRIQFRPGDEVTAIDGSTFVVDAVEERDGLLFYHGEGDSLCELLLSHHMRLDAPEERLSIGQWAPPADFSLRRDALQLLSQWMSAPVRGLLGARTDLLPHQLFLAHEAAKRQRPRLLLADETGLGKTIEAGLILHQLHHTERAQRVLLLLPEPLQNQWFVEMLRRFHLIFRVIDEGHCAARESVDPGANPFQEDQLCLCSLPWLASQPHRAQQAMVAGWDLIVCDEAHHIELDTPAYELVSALSQQAWGVLLLTATPEQNGLEHHFARLQLLDPARYTDEEAFLHDHQRYRDLAALAESLLDPDVPLDEQRLARIQADDPALFDAYTAQATEEMSPSERQEALGTLLDRYGLGRVMFRNTRARIQGFPERIVKLYPLDAAPGSQRGAPPLTDDPRLPWLLELLDDAIAQDWIDEKILIMCTTKATTTALHQALQAERGFPIALFHEGQSLLQRDRSAVYFNDPEGAHVMLCSAVGGEGRNFQAARHLLLFDLPDDPEQLDQRIGRLDRIGQGPSIEIHVPYTKGTAQEVQARWFHEGLQGFDAPILGGYQLYQQMRSRLDDCKRGFWLSKEQQADLVSLLEETATAHEALAHELTAGRDKLLELSSFDPARGEALREEVMALQRDKGHQETILGLFSHFGVVLEGLDEGTWKLQPGPRLHEGFPWLRGDAMRATFHRGEALAHPTTHFLSIEHPMVQGSLELLLGAPDSSCCVGVDEDADEQGIWLEALFVWECTAPQHLNIKRFVPPSPQSITVDHTMADISDAPTGPHQWSPSQVASLALASRRWLEHKSLLHELIPAMIERCRELAEASQAETRRSFQRQAEAALVPEIERLRHLREHNPDVTAEEIELAEASLAQINKHIGESYLRLDALRLTLRGMPQPG